MLQGNKLASLFLSVIIILLFGCGAGVGDTSEDLGNGYLFRSEGSSRWIRAEYIYQDGIDGNVVDYKYDKLFIIGLQEPSDYFYTYSYTGNLISKYHLFLYDTNLIKKPDQYQQEFLNSKWWTDTVLRNKIMKHITPENYNNDEEIGKITDSVFKNDPYFVKIFSRKQNFWIIRKGDYKLFGPFTKDEYLLKRNELNIPKELKLNSE